MRKYHLKCFIFILLSFFLSFNYLDAGQMQMNENMQAGRFAGQYPNGEGGTGINGVRF